MTFLAVLPKLTERRFLQQLIGTMNPRLGRRQGGLLRMFGWLIWHDEATNAPRRCPKCRAEINLPRNEPGFPDLFLVRGDLLILAELKADRGRLSQAQQVFRDALRKVKRVRYCEWRPKQLDDIVNEMR